MCRVFGSSMGYWSGCRPTSEEQGVSSGSCSAAAAGSGSAAGGTAAAAAAGEHMKSP